jgi:hypothetical protein
MRLDESDTVIKEHIPYTYIGWGKTTDASGQRMEVCEMKRDQHPYFRIKVII